MSRAMDDKTIARRRALGIPVHLGDDEHEWRADGYCNCGADRRGAAWTAHHVPDSGVVTKWNLDIIEHNEDNR